MQGHWARQLCGIHHAQQCCYCDLVDLTVQHEEWAVISKQTSWSKPSKILRLAGVHSLVTTDILCGTSSV